MSLNFALLVTGPAYGTQSASTAYRFALSLIEQGHRLSHLFFYQDGVCNGNGLHAPASDESNLVALWRELANQQGSVSMCASPPPCGAVCWMSRRPRGWAGHTSTWSRHFA